jgi:hypothetical protein
MVGSIGFLFEERKDADSPCSLVKVSKGHWVASVLGGNLAAVSLESERPERCSRGIWLFSSYKNCSLLEPAALGERAL